MLQKNLPDVRASQAPAEEIPAGDASYDVVVSAQAFHWFDLDRALPEIARVLKPRGRLSLVWNQRDERIPWVKRLGAIIGTQDQLRDPAEKLDGLEAVRRASRSESFKFWQVVDRTRSRTWSAPAPTSRPWRRPSRRPRWPRCSRSTTSTAAAWTACSCRTPRAASAPQVLDRVTPTLTENRSTEDDDGGQVSDGSSTDMLLIDFR